MTNPPTTRDGPNPPDSPSPPHAKTSRGQRPWRTVGVVVLLTMSAILWFGGQYVSDAREAARTSSCNCQLKQFGLALHNYHDTYGCFPPAVTLGPDGSAWHSWRVLILPFLECDPLYRRYRFDEPWDGPNNRRLLNEMPAIYGCPSRPRPATAALFGGLTHALLGCTAHDVTSHKGLTSYSVPLGRNTVFPGIFSISQREITDGTSNTILVCESTRTRIPWTKPEDIDVAQHPKLGDPDGFSGSHVREVPRVYALFADGTVHFLRTDMPQATVDALFTRNGGETIANDF